MNILTDKLPNVICIDGVEIPARTDYRTWVKVGELFRDSENETEPETLTADLIDLICVDGLPDEVSIGDFVSAVIAFYRGFPHPNSYARERNQSGGKTTGANVKRIPDYDLIADASFIYSSFLICYGIRLQMDEDMHWWEFLTLFDGLFFHDNNAMQFVVETRQTEMKDVPKYDKARIQRMKKIFALPKSEKTVAAERRLAEKLSAQLVAQSDGEDGIE